MDEIIATSKNLVAKGRGILAADESGGTIKKRFDSIGVESTPENHRIYRQMLFTTDGIEEFISGVILFDETIRQSTDEGISFPKYLLERGVTPGIKVDKGKVDFANFPGEKITEGLDGLKDRLSEYKSLGAKFTKWRAVITIGENIPSKICIESNSELLARFASMSQEVGLVPIVEPEVLMDGKHDIGKCEEVTYSTLKVVFSKLESHKVSYEGMLLKPNMVISGKESEKQSTSKEVAEATLRCFSEVLPPKLPGVMFLSGGQLQEQATENLNEINKIGRVPWELSFSFGRALQQSTLHAWQGKNDNLKKAQEVFFKRVKLNGAARFGKYTREMEEKDGE